MTHLTDDEKTELLRLCEAAPPGLWRAVENRDGTLNIVRDYIEDGESYSTKICLVNAKNRSAAAFIAAARTALPRILTERDELRAEIKCDNEQIEAKELREAYKFRSDGDAHIICHLLDELAELRAERDEARASIAWVNELNPSTNYESDGAIVHITFEEFDAMRACLGIRPAHRGKEKVMTISRRWFRQTVSDRDAAIARAEKAEADRDGARTVLALSNASLNAIVERAQCAERENRELKAAIKSALWRLSTDQDRSGTVVLLRTVLKDDQK